jgi:hypothetical protein
MLRYTLLLVDWGGLVVLFVSAAEENPTEIQKDPFASLGGGHAGPFGPTFFKGPIKVSSIVGL